ncbi:MULTISPECIES: DUF2480 family protein [unclassified Siphonobacter]|uniref:DUF2480 family protein n=1 Tax=unclassified Siphonobacter TaxID=2635712 RepID=UPI000CA9E6C4|nr:MULTISPECIES: DUF2480 family protein [unclassified Siphonobacter]MDQ1086377.1 hypothetical protein [Siphonobacter sp. SORGH_AS_1065]MDR6196652.1 hypothetical protein [Siphonobacter sp. SORGH_AS_0500]PKK35419.1 hypothetical protein BWI96_17050 [Siphonobacter sp. SORGH_AS_0500]
METPEIINRVANSGIKSLDLEEYYHQGERIIYDLKDNLFMEAILREKDFREFLKNHDWSQYADKNVAIICSADAIVPTWAYMLLAVHLEPYAHQFVFGDLQALEDRLFQDALSQINPQDYEGARVVVKGCSTYPVPISAYVEITRKLRPVVQTLMFGEPCSTVPLYKKAKK